jgi:hypothetical protein
MLIANKIQSGQIGDLWGLVQNLFLRNNCHFDVETG